MSEVILNKQLVRLGYEIHNLRKKPWFNLTMLTGTCVLMNNNVALLGNSIIGSIDANKGENKFTFTNNQEMQKMLSEQSVEDTIAKIAKDTNHTVFFCSLIDLLVHKANSNTKSPEAGDRGDQYKAAILEFSSKEYRVSVSIKKDIRATVTKKDEKATMMITEIDLIKDVLKHVDTLDSLKLEARTNKGSRTVIIEGMTPYIFKELFFYFNRTIVAEYFSEDGAVHKLYLFDKQVVDVVQTTRNTIGIITYSINKMPEVYPHNIYLETITYKDLIDRITDDIEEIGLTPVKLRR